MKYTTINKEKLDFINQEIVRAILENVIDEVTFN